MSSELGGHNGLSASLAKFQKAKQAVAESGAALVKGACVLGAALSHDLGTGVAKIMGNYADYGVTQGYVQARKYMKAAYASGLGRHLPALTPAQESRFAAIFAGLAGSPTDLMVMAGSGMGVGSYFRLANTNASGAINPLAETLDSKVLWVDDPHAVLASLVAITCYAAVRVFIEFRGMEAASLFEQRRQEAAVAADQFSIYLEQGADNRSAMILADLAAGAKKAYEASYGSLPRISDAGVVLIEQMRQGGCTDFAIAEALGQDNSEDARQLDQVSRMLADNYLMPSSQAGKVALDLILLHGGDTPLLRNRLASRVLPSGWVASYGFDPHAVVGEVRLKDRPSETAKLFAATWSRIADRFGRSESSPGGKDGMRPK